MKKIYALLVVLIAASAWACCKSEYKPVFIGKQTPDLLAEVDGKPIYEKDLSMKEQMDLYEKKKQIIETRIRLETLDDFMKKKGYKDRNEFFEKEIKGKVKKPTESDIKKFYNERGIKQPFESIKQQIENALVNMGMRERQEKFFGDLMKNTNVVMYFTKPRAEIVLGDDETIEGSKNAPVKLVEYTDFQCPYCKKTQATIKELKKKYGSKLAHVFKNFPLPMHDQARNASNAALCANEQGKFWPFHDIVFERQNELSEAAGAQPMEKPGLPEPKPTNVGEKFIAWAKESGLDTEKFKKCYDAKAYDAKIQKDMDGAEELGVSSTPTFFVNGVPVMGALPVDEFSKIIDEELKAKK